MMRRLGHPVRGKSWWLLAALLPCAASAWAHHSHSSLNREDRRLMQGVVTAYLWRSPHVYLKANVLGDDGEPVEYAIELTNPMSMSRAGWTKTTWSIGERIVWEGARDRNPKRAYMGLDWAEKADGTRLYTMPEAQRRYLEREGKEIPDYLQQGKASAPAQAIGEGTWSRIAADGGRFKHIYNANSIKDWPLSEKARRQVENFSETDNPLNQCIVNGPPRGMLTLPKFQWTRPDAGRILIDRDLWPQKRVIHLAEQAPPAAQSPPVAEPSPFGHSVGWFENGELHIATKSFAGEPWGLFWGLDSSDQLTLRERYWLSEGGLRLNLEMTIDDPVMLTRPVTLTHQWRKIADSEITHAECSLENANFFLTAGYN